MSLASQRFFPRTFLFLILVTTLSAVVNGQQRSREELLKEAGKLATEAERARGATIKKAGGDHKLLREAEKVVAEAFEKAIELWREAGDDQRLIAGVEELTRIYSVLGEYERVLDRLTSEAEYWRERGKVAEQTNTLYVLGLRQWQMKREAAAIETLERVAAMSRSAGLSSLEPNALSHLAQLYAKAGRSNEAQTAEERARKLWSVASRTPARAPDPITPATIPPQWVDLPGAPAVAEYREVDGVNQAVLANHSYKGIEMVAFGCVALEDTKKVRVLYGLMGQGLNHGGVRPGSYYHSFPALNGPMNRWTDEKLGCEGAARLTLIEAHFDDGTTWKADGINWQP